MLTEEQLEYISSALVPLFQYLEHEVIAVSYTHPEPTRH